MPGIAYLKNGTAEWKDAQSKCPLPFRLTIPVTPFKTIRSLSAERVSFSIVLRKSTVIPTVLPLPLTMSRGAKAGMPRQTGSLTAGPVATFLTTRTRNASKPKRRSRTSKTVCRRRCSMHS
jgi:hypothetical protein